MTNLIDVSLILMNLILIFISFQFCISNHAFMNVKFGQKIYS